MNPFRSLRDYEDFIYTLQQRYASIQRSTLIIVPPDIKHNRQLAPGMSFTNPNLPKLIEEIEELIEKTK